MITRRHFLAGSGGLVLAFTVRESLQAAALGEAPGGTMLTAFLAIGTDGSVTLSSPTTEMGQGTHTGHALVIAEELGVDLERMRVETAEPADPFRRNGSMSSGGSWGMRAWYEPLRKVAAQARAMLLAAAAAEWGVRADELTLERGWVKHAASQRAIGIGALAAAAGQLEPPADAMPRSPRAGRADPARVPRVDLPAKIRGEPVFASDIVRPGMLYACARLAPAFGAEVEAIDEAPALAITGVRRVVRIPGGAAVVADHSWAAIQGAEALRVDFKPTGHEQLDTAAISARMRAGLDRDDAAIEARSDADAIAAIAGAERAFSAEYEAPFLAHAPMEPWTCTVEFDADGVLHLWAPSQAQDRYRVAAASAAGIDPDRVRVHTTMLGGGFGRRLGADGVPGAVETAVAVGRPVKFFWRREDEFGQGWYRPAQAARMRAAVDEKGKVTALHVRTCGPSLANSFSARGLPAGELDSSSVQTLRDSRYRPGAFRVDWVRVDLPVPLAPWRSVGATQNGYFMECFLDELAKFAGRDPYELRRELLSHDPRALRVIDAVARASGWGTPLAEGRARGMAFVESYGSLCAQVAEVSLQEGRPQVHRVVCALDCGAVVLPDGVRAQIEGGIVMGLSAAMGEAVAVAGGAAVNTNFDTYPLLRMADAPAKIESIIIESGEAMGGVGEPPLPPTAPAVANALFALTGKPVRRLPLSEMRWS